MTVLDFGKKGTNMAFTIEIEKEEDGRWIAEIPQLPGVLAYGQSRELAIQRVETLSLRVIADRLENGESIPELGDVFSVAPWKVIESWASASPGARWNAGERS